MNMKFDHYGSSLADGCTRAIELLIVILLGFAPLAFGVSNPWSEQLALVLISIISILFLIKLAASPRTRFAWHWCYLPVLLFVLLVGLQLVSLPTWLVKILSPHTVTLKTELLSSLNIPGLDLSTMTLSFYALATRHDFGLLIGAASLFVIVLNTFTSAASIKRLLVCITVIGGAIALLAIAQWLTQTDKYFWFIPSGRKVLTGGPFVNRNHFAQFMNLSIGAAIALALVQLRELFGTKRLDADTIWEQLASDRARIFWMACAVVVLGAVSIFLALSRGGIISLLTAACALTCMLTLGRRHSGGGQLIVITVLLAFVCILYLGFNAVYERMATLHDISTAASGRTQILADIARMWTRFPFFGTGLGTHSVVYPMFDSSTVTALASHAENEYAQMVEETGLLGLGLLVLFGVAIWISFARNLARAQHPIQQAGYGLGFGLLAIMVHSLSDFGQHLPANHLLSLIFCALLLVLCRMNQDPLPVSPRPGLCRTTPSLARERAFFRVARTAKQAYLNNTPIQPDAVQTEDEPLEARWSFSTQPCLTRVSRILLLILGCCLWTWILLHASRSAKADAHRARALDLEQPLREKNWEGSDNAYIALLTQADAAVEDSPTDVALQHLLNAYRWYSITRPADPNTDMEALSAQRASIAWRIVDEFKKACVLCPTYGPNYSFMGRLQALVLGDPAGEEHIKTGYRLAPCNAMACFQAGSLDARQGNRDAALEKYARAVALDGRYFEAAALVCMTVLDDPNSALALAGDDTGKLSTLVRLFTQAESEQDTEHYSGATLGKIRQILEQKSQQADVSASVLAALARIYSKEGRVPEAIALYRKALRKDYGRLSWRYQLAKCLEQQGQIADALHQVKICVRLNGQYGAAQRLIEELAVKIPPDPEN